MAGVFITFEGTEGGGKSTQIALLAARLRENGHKVRTLREPGGTPIGEEIRHLLKHSEANRAMTPEAELLLMNASRAQLVREVIRPALAEGEIVLCDRFYHSTIAYQGYGRGLDLGLVHSIIAAAVGETKPDLTLVLLVPIAVSEQRRLDRQQLLLQSPAPTGGTAASPQFDASLRDRMGKQIGLSSSGSKGATKKSVPAIPIGFGALMPNKKKTQWNRRFGPKYKGFGRGC
jgi:dTMP kinase